MIVSLSAQTKLNCSTVDCGIKIKAESYSKTGGYIFKQDQLALAGMGKPFIRALTVNKVVGVDGKTYLNHCVLSKRCVIELGESDGQTQTSARRGAYSKGKE